MSSVAYSASGTTTAGYPKDDNLQTAMRTVIVMTLGAGETATITHGRDSELARRVEVLNSSGGIASGITVVRASATTTTVAATGAGTYRVIIEY